MSRDIVDTVLHIPVSVKSVSSSDVFPSSGTASLVAVIGIGLDSTVCVRFSGDELKLVLDRFIPMNGYD